ncbi:hypothetical protein CWI37_0294p0030 [Hamiltosporidium tvaerminnensis]|uniref:Uncharacterized protein n=1 Tax=Hamiltosporidium tvaerminnensis TaxID=1176355 RepID=A0A4Q9L701_9MICR|nr:hypothetical protein CWI37_0294p0030 [Hamiltosporidium tvaerminnensis]
MKKICLYELGSTHISVKNLLLVISNHLERIELFSSKINIEMLNFLNQKDILVSLKSIYFLNPINKISECAFTGFNNNLEVSFSKNLNDFIVLKPEHENMTLFGIFHTKFDKNFRKNIILSENFEYSFDSNESNVNIDLDSFKNDEMVKLFYIVSNNNIYIEKTIYFVNECNEKDSFILIYNGIKKSDFEFFKLWDRPIQSIRIYGCFLETDDLFQIIRFKSLKTMHIENSILKNDLKNPIFHDNNIETVFFKSNIIYNLDLFFSFLDSFKLNTRFKLDIKQNSSIGLEN